MSENVHTNAEILRENRELREALRALIDKLKVILPKVDGMIALQSARMGMNAYNGPNLEAELAEIERLLAERGEGTR